MDDPCSICFRTSPEFLLTCGHRFCRECLIGHGTQCFYNPEGIRCPERDCSSIISKTDLEEIFPPETFSKYKLSKKKRKHQLSDCPKCGDLCKIQQTSIVTCACGHEFCFFHSDAHPITQTCQEYEEEFEGREDIRLSMELIGGECRNCPGCTNPVEKSGGCDHIKCVWCGTKFCFGCGGTTFDGVEMPTCTGCGQGFIDHDYFWKFQLCSILTFPFWFLFMMIHALCGLLCCVFQCWWTKLDIVTPGITCCEKLRSICIWECVCCIICGVFWHCGPWDGLDEPPDDLNNISSIVRGDV